MYSSTLQYKYSQWLEQCFCRACCWEDNRQGSPNRGNRLFVSLKILCCHDDTWFHQNLTFLKPWADNRSTNQYSYQLFYGWGMTHLVPSYLKNAYCGRAAWWNSLSSEVSLFLTDIKCLAKNKQRGILFVPFWCLSQKLSLLVLYFNKTLLHKKLQIVKPCLWPQIRILSSEGHESWLNTWLEAATFQKAAQQWRLLLFLVVHRP